MHNSKEESITQQADEIISMYNQINDDLENSNKQVSGMSKTSPFFFGSFASFLWKWEKVYMNFHFHKYLYIEMFVCVYIYIYMGV